MKRPAKFVLTIGAVILLIAATAGCLSFSPGADVIVGNGQVIQQERQLNEAVTGAGTQSPIDLILDPELDGKVILDGESNILDLVEVSQNSGGFVEIKFKKGVMISSLKTVKAYIPVPAGSNTLLETSSTGSISAKNSASLTGDSLVLKVSSTGSITLNATFAELNASSSSTGRISLTGEADKATISLSSTGDFNGFDFKIVDATVSVSSTGSARVNVSGNLKGSISSVGNIIYDGTPASINVTTSSIGQVKKR